jgi:hypothetical protein
MATAVAERLLRRESPHSKCPDVQPLDAFLFYVSIGSSTVLVRVYLFTFEPHPISMATAIVTRADGNELGAGGR